SVTSHNSPGGSSGPCQMSLPTPPRRIWWSSATEPGRTAFWTLAIETSGNSPIAVTCPLPGPGAAGDADISGEADGSGTIGSAEGPVSVGVASCRTASCVGGPASTGRSIAAAVTLSATAASAHAVSRLAPMGIPDPVDLNGHRVQRVIVHD